MQSDTLTPTGSRYVMSADSRRYLEGLAVRHGFNRDLIDADDRRDGSLSESPSELEPEPVS